MNSKQLEVCAVLCNEAQSASCEKWAKRQQVRPDLFGVISGLIVVVPRLVLIACLFVGFNFGGKAFAVVDAPAPGQHQEGPLVGIGEKDAAVDGITSQVLFDFDSQGVGHGVEFFAFLGSDTQPVAQERTDNCADGTNNGSCLIAVGKEAGKESGAVHKNPQANRAEKKDESTNDRLIFYFWVGFISFFSSLVGSYLLARFFG